MYTAWVAVLAVLKIQFAQLIALGAAIGDFVAQLLRVPATQVMVHVMDKDSHKSRIVWKSNSELGCTTSRRWRGASEI